MALRYPTPAELLKILVIGLLVALPFACVGALVLQLNRAKDSEGIDELKQVLVNENVDYNKAIELINSKPSLIKYAEDELIIILKNSDDKTRIMFIESMMPGFPDGEYPTFKLDFMMGELANGAAYSDVVRDAAGKCLSAWHD